MNETAQRWAGWLLYDGEWRQASEAATEPRAWALLGDWRASTGATGVIVQPLANGPPTRALPTSGLSAIHHPMDVSRPRRKTLLPEIFGEPVEVRGQDGRVVLADTAWSRED